MRSRKVHVPQRLPHPHHILHAQRDEVRDTPQERERVQPLWSRPLSTRGVHVPVPHARRSGHERVGDEEPRVVVQNHLETTQIINSLDGLIVEKRDAVPQDIALGRLDQDSALPNSQSRRGRYKRDVRIRSTRRPFVLVLLL
ncbi:hypothetical protein HG530_007702 [Fusarium avenaceum]|nr:hypothetical protein HG530_007702 [Fusarium avenaceum]